MSLSQHHNYITTSYNLIYYEHNFNTLSYNFCTRAVSGYGLEMECVSNFDNTIKIFNIFLFFRNTIFYDYYLPMQKNYIDQIETYLFRF